MQYGKVVFLFCLPIWGWAQVHYAKLEPYQTYLFKAAYGGLVTKALDAKEGRKIGREVIVQIDDRIDRAQLIAVQARLKTLQKSLTINQTMTANQRKVYERNRRYYTRIKDLKTKSQTEKDRIYAAMITSHNQLLSLQEKIASLAAQIADFSAQRTALEDRIEKKAIRPEGLYLYKVAVRKGDYVNPGALLVKAMDTTKARLILYLDPDEVVDLKQKKIMLDGKVVDGHFEKVLKVADETHISSYRAELIVDRPKELFSRLVKVEILKR